MFSQLDWTDYETMQPAPVQAYRSVSFPECTLPLRILLDSSVHCARDIMQLPSHFMQLYPFLL